MKSSAMIGKVKGMVCMVLVVGLGAAALSSKGVGAEAGGVADAIAERKRAMVMVEYTLEREEDRHSVEVVGMVYDGEGGVVCLAPAFANWVPVDWYKNIKVYLADNASRRGYSAEYEGHNLVTGWHYLRVTEAAALEYLKPVTAFGVAEMETGMALWGMGMANGDYDYKTYYLEGRLSAVLELPEPTGYVTGRIGVPGSLVFDGEGRFAGWVIDPISRPYQLMLGRDTYPVQLLDSEESTRFVAADSVIADLGARRSPAAAPVRAAWMGIYGTEPVGKETAGFLGIEDQGALVIGEVLKGMPAEAAGLRGGDILVGLDGQRLPRLKPDGVVSAWFEREMRKRAVGETVELTVMRGSEELAMRVELVRGPKTLREAQQRYFEAAGFSAREMLVGDAIEYRADPAVLSGAIVSYIKPNSPAAAAELSFGDWIQQIDGQAVDDWAAAAERLEAALAAQQREIVLLVRRGNETAVLRLQLQQ